MTGFTTRTEFIGNAYGQARKPVGIFIKSSLYLVEVGKLGAVDMIAECFGHAELEPKIKPLRGLELETDAQEAP